MHGSSFADDVIGLVGVGAMGQRIAQVAIQGDLQILLFDSKDGAVELACQTIRTRLDCLVEKGRLGQADADAMIARLTPITSIDAIAKSDVVIEAITGDDRYRPTLGLKQRALSDARSLRSDYVTRPPWPQPRSAVVRSLAPAKREPLASAMPGVAPWQ